MRLSKKLEYILPLPCNNKAHGLLAIKSGDKKTGNTLNINNALFRLL